MKRSFQSVRIHLQHQNTLWRKAFTSSWLFCVKTINFKDLKIKERKKKLHAGAVSIATWHGIHTLNSVIVRSKISVTWSRTRRHSRARSKKKNKIKSNSVTKRHWFLNEPRALQYVCAARLNTTFGTEKCIGPYYIQCKIITIFYSHKNIIECMRSVWLKVNQDFKIEKPQNNNFLIIDQQLSHMCRRALVFQMSQSVSQCLLHMLGTIHY